MYLRSTSQSTHEFCLKYSVFLLSEANTTEIISTQEKQAKNDSRNVHS
jgi:hypothetical protein